MHFAKAASLGVVAVLAVACGGITIPSIPAIPSFSIPSFSLPSGGGTLPPGVIPSTSGTCNLISAAEVTGVMGNTATLSEVDETTCTFVMSNFASINVEVASDTDLTGVKTLMGSTAKDVTVAGLPGVSGAIFGQAAVYVQKGANQLQVLGILTGSDDATIAKIVQIATVAVSRMP